MIRQLTWPHQLTTRQALPVAANSENSTMAVGTSKKINSTPSIIMPPAMPKTPDTSEATNTATPIAASATNDMCTLPLQHQPGRPPELDAADNEDDSARPLTEVVIRHSLDHVRRERRSADGKCDSHQHVP